MKINEFASEYLNTYNGSEVKINWIDERESHIVYGLSDGKTVFADDGANVYLNTYRDGMEIVWSDEAGWVYENGTSIDWGDEVC